MTTKKLHSLRSRTAAAVMATLMAIPIVATGSVSAAPYTPIQGQAPSYTGSLNWVNYTQPIGAGELPNPSTKVTYSIDFDHNDNLYVTKFGNTNLSATGTGSIEKIAPDGQTISDITFNSNVTFPVGIMADQSANVYITDNTYFGSGSSSNATINVPRVLRLMNGATSWEDITPDLTMRYAMGVTADPQGNVYVVDSNNSTSSSSSTTLSPPRVLKLAVGDDTWVDISNSDSEFGDSVVFDIVADGEGNLFVSVLTTSIGGSGIGGGKILKLAAGETDWVNVTPAADPNSVIPFIPYGLGIDKYDNLFAMNLFMGAVAKLGYGGGSGDWTMFGVLPTNSALMAGNFDVAADNAGYVFGSNLTRGNVITLRAVVAYNGNGNASGTAPTDLVGYKPGETATVLGGGDLARPGYTFAGWSTDPQATAVEYAPGSTINMSQSVALYAVWTAGPSDSASAYTVTYAAGSGGTLNGAASESVTGGGHPASIPTPIADSGNTFLGWSSDGGATMLSSKELAAASITGNVTYTAYFQQPAALTRIELDKTSYSIAVGQSHQTVVAAVYSDSSKRTLEAGVNFASSDTAVATVDSAGVVRAVTSGQAVISAEYLGQHAQATVTVPSGQSNESSSTTSPSTNQTGTGIPVMIDGVEQETLATAKKQIVAGRQVTTVVLDNQKVIDKLNRENNKILTIPVAGNNPVVVGQLTGSLVKTMESNGAQIQIATDRATYTLPAAQVNIDAISPQFGQDVNLADITISIQIADTSDDNKAKMEKAAEGNGSTMVVQPVDFEIYATYGTQTVQANTFNSYVGRMIALPDGVDPNSITTGVVLTASGELYHVPTVVVQEGGKAYALINSLTNSSYTVIYNPREMTDVVGHWAQADVNDMSSRLIVQGVTDSLFAPNAAITRAEFAAIVTRGLGIQHAPYSDSLSDVGGSDWYAGAVQAAVHYGLVTGYEDGTFRPDANISRQEAAAVLVRASRIAKLESAKSDAQPALALSAYADSGAIAAWARASVAEAIDLELMKGREGKLDPSADLTRAETAALVRRLLQAADLINE